MYRFHQAALTYSTCLDPPFAWRRLPAWVLEQLWPRMRSNQMTVAARPAASRLIAPEEIAPLEGLHEVARHPESGGGTPRVLTTPFRWSDPRATLGFPVGDAAYQVFTLHVADLKPEALPTGIWRLTVNGRKLPSVWACALTAPSRPCTWSCPARWPRVAGATAASRSASRAPPGRRPNTRASTSGSTIRATSARWGWSWAGVLREDCAGLAELRALAAELMAGERASRPRRRAGASPRAWTNAGPPGAGLHLARARLGPACAMGRHDWPFLGAGRHHLERGDVGQVRWSAEYAEVFLRAPKTSAPLSLRLRASAGHPALGAEVEAALAWSWSVDGLTFAPPARPRSCARRPGCSWTMF